ncbi:hypothetical protein L3X38_010821 [Prunus dulcis]|uniref:Uncharacterized protein n=1 Tax=Prunus dulcis TaxID=3755 RepID=A0AAD4WGC8_PRUDU|nr:hypothetical protein L3X38_010821 [Prunus dulcis]
MGFEASSSFHRLSFLLLFIFVSPTDFKQSETSISFALSHGNRRKKKKEATPMNDVVASDSINTDERQVFMIQS